MFWNGYRLRLRNRRWRKLRFREAARRSKTGKQMRRLKSVLAAILCLELAVGAGQLQASGGPDIRFLRREESLSIEWTEQDEDQEVYGIRFLPDSLELQFYHRSRQIFPAGQGFGIINESNKRFYCISKYAVL